MDSLQNQRVLIVGGARDIGLAVAGAVADAGGTAVIGARGAAKAESAAASIPGAEHVLIDITDEGSVTAALDAAAPLDHIVITTSAHHNVPVTELEHDATVTAFETKVIGPLLLAKHAAGRLPAHGSILLFSGQAAWKPSPGYSIMGITNGAVSFAAKHLAVELAPVRVNAISPGVIDSGSWDSMGAADKEAFLSSSAEGTLVKRVGRNRDITDAVLWLLTAGFVTGETIHVEGGAPLA
ncbi:SDR family oxidoreductase [Corynebacterium pacaense]|uniref:SDR family oxidoreductase n=1 Tax=Corynebacterium pacaense TaxID=1816684 RepID=UPI0009BBC633|nr:SDR family oxidoreductase [Corynebacterium pacaense]